MGTSRITTMVSLSTDSFNLKVDLTGLQSIFQGVRNQGTLFSFLIQLLLKATPIATCQYQASFGQSFSQVEFIVYNPAKDILTYTQKATVWLVCQMKKWLYINYRRH